jgi:hypothetical protein
MRYLPPLIAVLGLTLLTPLCLAGQLNSAPTKQFATPRSAGFPRWSNALSRNNVALDQSNLRLGGRGDLNSSAPTVSTALSTALSVGNPAKTAAVNTNLPVPANVLSGEQRAPVVELNNAPSVQAAIGAAVSIDGNASALATNSNGGVHESQH